MNFYDLVNCKDEHIGDIVEFDDKVCILKLNLYKKVHCFENFYKLERFINQLRIPKYKIIENGLFDIPDDE